VQKADLEPRGGCYPEKVALDETVVKVEGEQYWFVAAVEPSTNRILDAGLYSHKNMAMTSMFFEEHDEKHDGRDADSSSMAASGCTLSSTSSACTFGTKPSATETQLNVSSKRPNDVLISVTITSETQTSKPSKTDCSHWPGQKII
jgi:hypothetical protein